MRKYLLENVLPFWLDNAIDDEFGGILTCLDREGKIYGYEKSVWFQGRALYIFSSAYNYVEKNDKFLNAAKKIYDFLPLCGDETGRMYFTVTREGKEIQKFAHANGMTTLSIMDEQPFCDEVVECKPDEILSYVKNADCVITDTFHGTIFSIIYHKPFAVFCRKKSDTGSTNAEKLLDLLQRLDLMDCVIEDVSNISNILGKKIDYSKVDIIQNEERKKTLDYLDRELKIQPLG